MENNEKEIHKKVAMKAIQDESFRERFLKNPKEILEKEFNFRCPSDVQIKTIEPKEGELVILYGKNVSTEGTEAKFGNFIKKLNSDKSFLEKVKANPVEMLNKELGAQLPRTTKIRLVEQTEKLKVFILPSASLSEGEELSDAELQAASGGAGGQGIFILGWGIGKNAEGKFVVGKEDGSQGLSV